MIHPIYRVVSFAIVAPYTLRVTFDDTTTQVIDLTHPCGRVVQSPCGMSALFNQVQLDPEVHTLVWPNGADFGLPATLHDWPEHLKSLKALAHQWALAATLEAEPGFQQPAGDGLQRPLVPRSRCQPRLRRSVGRQRDHQNTVVAQTSVRFLVQFKERHGTCSG